MNKSGLVTALAGRTKISNAQAAAAVEAIFNADHGIVAEELGAGRTVTVTGFGTFAARKRAARKGRNPATGKAITIASRKVPVFKVSSALRVTVAKSGRIHLPPGRVDEVGAHTRLYCPVRGCPTSAWEQRKGEELVCPYHGRKLVPRARP